ncbi:DUF6527 family protein [Streptomyces sp. ME18-1-4]|uniref:DUF6527 family protein n=1 Tax=Streptomyces sp. ME18-1-4 TaxID=3028685 RepID=UPI0039F6CBD7
MEEAPGLLLGPGAGDAQRLPDRRQRAHQRGHPVKPVRLTHRFVEYIPEDLERGVLYVSLPYTIAVHLCACGCGSTVVTPLGPTDRSLTFDGVAVSLSPSIGNWSYRTLAQCSTLQGGGVGHPRHSGPEGRGTRVRIALSDDVVVRPTAGRAESNACGGPCKTSSRKGAGKGL